MNGDCARRASRRGISVLPPPVGPIIRMFFGVTSSAMSCGSCWRGVRWRSAMATARFAFAWPITYLSSSATIWRGVRERTAVAVRSGKKIAIRAPWLALQLLYREIRVRVDADVRGNLHRFGRDLTGIELAVLRQRARSRQRERSSASHRHYAIVRLDQIARAAQHERRTLVGD